MKLVHYDWDFQILFEENVINRVVIENRRCMAKYVGEMLSQIGGEENGGFVLSDNDKTLALQKNAFAVLDPFSAEVNSKAVLGGLYKKLLCSAVSEDLFLETEKIKSGIYTYINTLVDTMDYPVVFNEDIDLHVLLKSAGVQLTNDFTSITEKIISYLSVMRDFCNTRLAVFVNLGSFLDDEDIAELYQFSAYEKYPMLFIENCERARINDMERTFIIDSDNCQIFEGVDKNTHLP